MHAAFPPLNVPQWEENLSRHCVIYADATVELSLDFFHDTVGMPLGARLVHRAQKGKGNAIVVEGRKAKRLQCGAFGGAQVSSGRGEILRREAKVGGEAPKVTLTAARVNGHLRKPASSVTATWQTLAGHAIHKERERDEIELEANRMFKKRRTSRRHHPRLLRTTRTTLRNMLKQETRFELQKHLQDIRREPGADPNGPDW